MHRREFLTAAAALGAAAPILHVPSLVFAATAARVTGPHTHVNLALYFVHGPSAPGPVPLTLQEALAKRQVIVHETSDVNRLMIENRGDEEVFVQAGEIVKGGKQDRVLTVSLLLPKNSGVVPIGAYCVEQGRWQARGREDVSKFSIADSAVPSRKAKIAMKAPAEPTSSQDRIGRHEIRRSDETGRRQQEMWKDVEETQRKLAGTVGAPVKSAESQSSLQLSLENKQVKANVAEYVKALDPAIKKAPDALGLAFAINGAINSADLYPSHGLFVKLWPKLLTAAATEAVAEKNGKPGTPPKREEIVAFLERSEQAGKSTERKLDGKTSLATRESEKTYYFETRRDAQVVHKNYLAR